MRHAHCNDYACPCGKVAIYRITPFSATTLVWSKGVMHTTDKNSEYTSINVCSICYTLNQAFFNLLLDLFNVYREGGYG